MKSTFEYLFSTEEDGRDVLMGTNAEGDPIYFKLREAGCREHEKATRKYSKQLTAVRRNSKKEREILSKIMAESIIIDWKGVLDEKGKPVKCTMEEKLTALIKYKKLFYAVLNESNREENFRDIEDEIDDESELNEAEDTKKN